MESLKLSILDKPVKLLYILSELGDLTFNELVERSKLSRNTVSKYIKILLEEKKN
jgi:DNA-binding Lrp family transcriptional regulator